MKQNILFMLLLCCLPLNALQAQTTTHHNSVKTILPTVASTTTSGLTVNNSITTYQYYDALGRPFQTLQLGATPNQLDLVSHQEYDALGRESLLWLPVSATAGNNGQPLSLSTIRSRSQLSSNYGDSKAYSMPVYEASPLNLVTEKYGPGQEWHNNGKRVKMAYLTNAASGELACRWYRTTDTRNSVQLSIQSGKIYYPAGELYVSRVTDEEGTGVSLEFKNKQGELLLSRQKNGASFHDTYYVYDTYGNMRAVLPPMAADALASAGSWTQAANGADVLSRYAYLYSYDSFNRCTNKKLPGCGWVRYEYDRGNRLIWTQDSEQAAMSPAMFTFYWYDNYNRPVVQGVCEYKGTVCYIGSMMVSTSLYYSSDGYIHGQSANRNLYAHGRRKEYTDTSVHLHLRPCRPLEDGDS